MQQQKVSDKILFQNATIVDPHQGKSYTADILIDDGKIRKVQKEIPKSGIKRVVDLKGKSVAPGFIDLHVHFREPGFEDEETIATGARAALAGGFTQVCCMPNTVPPIATQDSVRLIYKKAEDLLVRVYPIAAITKGREGKELTEMGELAEAGAVAFSDDGTPLQNALLMRYALEYSRVTGKPVINHAEDIDLRADGLMNEGIVSTQLGLTANPAAAEQLMVYRDVMLAKLTGARIHIPHVSTAAAVAIIRQAKADGVRVTAEATPHHFTLTDEYMRSFSAQGKVAPPLRTEEDRQAIIAGLKDGTIDAIATDHAPHTYETKETSLDLASSGLIGLESAFGLAMTQLVKAGHLSLLDLVTKLTTRPAAVLDLPLPPIKAGEAANLTIFDPEEWWVFSRKDIYSKSHNTPFLGAEFTGRIKSVFTQSTYIEI